MERKALIKSKIAVVKKLQREIVESIKKDILSTPPLDCVRDVSVAPRTLIISFSTIKENRGILSPNYYIQEAQNQYMVNAIASCNMDFEKIEDKIREMIKTKYIFSKSQTKVPLNNNSLKKLNEILEEYFSEESTC